MKLAYRVLHIAYRQTPSPAISDLRYAIRGDAEQRSERRS